MSDRFHLGTFLWGLVLTVAGGWLFGDGVGWWEIGVIDLRYLAPALLILIGIIVLAGAISRPDRSGV